MTTKKENTSTCVGQEFIITREFAAPRELVWRACTEGKHVAQWWGPKCFSAPICEWDAKPGNKIYVIMRAPDGTDYPMGGQFHEVTPPERLVTTTGPIDDKGNLLFEIKHTLTLAEKNGLTKLTMHSKVIKASPGAERYIGGFEAGMTQSLERLGELLKSDAEPLVVERTFDAPVEKVWEAMTNVNNIGRWFFELKEFKPEVGFKFGFTVEHEGFTYIHQCKITDVISNKRLAFTWRYEGYEGDSLVTFELVAHGGKTSLRLTHDGLESFPKTPQFLRNNFMRAWTALSGELKDFAESPTGDREIFVQRDFDAPRELVWKALTSPEHVVNWWGPRGFTTTIETMDVRPGGVWKHVMRGPDGTNYPSHSVFKEVVEPERIVFSQGGRREGGPAVSFVATWTFEALEPRKTRLSIRMVFPSPSDRDFVAREFGAIEGAKQTLERLSEHLQKTYA